MRAHEGGELVGPGRRGTVSLRAAPPGVPRVSHIEPLHEAVTPSDKPVNVAAPDLSRTLLVKGGSLFLETGRSGDLDGRRNREHGLHFHGTRYLDFSVLRLDGRRPLRLRATTGRGDGHRARAGALAADGGDDHHPELRQRGGRPAPGADLRSPLRHHAGAATLTGLADAAARPVPESAACGRRPGLRATTRTHALAGATRPWERMDRYALVNVTPER